MNGRFTAVIDGGRTSGTWTFRLTSTDDVMIIGEVRAMVSSGASGYAATNGIILDVFGAAERTDRPGRSITATQRFSGATTASAGSTTSTISHSVSATVSGGVNIFDIEITHGGTSSDFSGESFLLDFLVKRVG